MVHDENTGAFHCLQRRARNRGEDQPMQAYAVIKEFTAFALLSLAGYVCLVVA